MNLNTFDGYCLEEQLQVVQEQGTYLLNRKGRTCQINLYHLGMFFVEVWYEPEDNYIKLVRSFAGSALLEPYLNNIQVRDLYAPLK